MECPRCEVKLKDIMKLKKPERIKLQRKYVGDVTYTIKGDARGSDTVSRGQIPTDGMTVTEHCKSCGWRSTRRYDAHNRKWIYETN